MYPLRSSSIVHFVIPSSDNAYFSFASYFCSWCARIFLTFLSITLFPPLTLPFVLFLSIFLSLLFAILSSLFIFGSFWIIFPYVIAASTVYSVFRSNVALYNMTSICWMRFASAFVAISNVHWINSMDDSITAFDVSFRLTWPSCCMDHTMNAQLCNQLQFNLLLLIFFNLLALTLCYRRLRSIGVKIQLNNWSSMEITFCVSTINKRYWLNNCMFVVIHGTGIILIEWHKPDQFECKNFNVRHWQFTTL